MTVFHFTPLVNDPLARIESAALGADADNPMTDNDVGKAVTLAAGAGANFILAAADAEIDGFVSNIMPDTVNGGWSWGGVQRSGRVKAQVGAGEAGTLIVGEYAVADTQTTLNTAGLAQVKQGTPSIHLWRCIRIITGTGATGDQVLLERV